MAKSIEQRAEIFKSILRAMGFGAIYDDTSILATLMVTDKIHETDGNVGMNDILAMKAEIERKIEERNQNGAPPAHVRVLAAMAGISDKELDAKWQSLREKHEQSSDEPSPQRGSKLERLEKHLAELKAEMEQPHNQDSIDNILEDISETMAKIAELKQLK